MTDAVTKSIQKARRAVLGAVKKLVTPHFHESGYSKYLEPSKGMFGKKRPLLLWAPENPLPLNGMAVEDVVAVTEDGIMIDSFGGGAVTLYWRSVPIEDLQKLHKKLTKIFA